MTWEAYELFKIGERGKHDFGTKHTISLSMADSDFAPDAFTTFIPITIGSGARSKIIFDFFDVLAAIVAHGKVNGFTGRKLSRYAAWWAFEFYDGASTFDSGYKTWVQAADATSHLFFAYLRSLSPGSAQGKTSILSLPRVLQHLLETTEYPPIAQAALQSQTAKVVITVDTVSPTPFALLRRAKHFQYREEDTVLRHFSDFDDPVAALTNECKRVLKSISSANDSTTAKHSTSLRDASWSRFEDIGFDTLSGEFDDADEPDESTLGKRGPSSGLMRSAASKTTDLGRPTTPSWADFMSSGFQEQVPNGNPSVLLPPDKALPHIGGRNDHSQHKRDDDSSLEPGELASISSFDLDDTFWWVWMTSLAGEETPQRKAAFGRCALVETKFGNQWIVMEEIVKGAAAVPNEGAYIAEKKSRFGFSTRRRLTRSKSTAKGALPRPEDALARSLTAVPMSSKVSIAPDQHARIQAAAAALQDRNRAHQQEEVPISPRRARRGDDVSVKTNSVLTLQPMIMSEAAPALQWASKYDKNNIRAKYLGDSFTGRGSNVSLLNGPTSTNPTADSLEVTANGVVASQNGPAQSEGNEREGLARKRTGSPEPRDEKAFVPASNQTLLEVLQNGPPNSQPYVDPRNYASGSAGKDTMPTVPERVASAPRTLPKDASSPPRDITAATAHDTPVAAAGSSANPIPRSKDTQETISPLPTNPEITSMQSIENQSTQLPAQQHIEKPSRKNDRAPSDIPVTNSAGIAAPISATAPALTQSPASKSNARPVSPETSRNKLQKKPTEKTGLRGFLGRRKREEPAKGNAAYKQPTSTSAVAAAKAALEAKAAMNNKGPEPPTRVTSKRFSTIAPKAETEPTLNAESIAVQQEDKDERPVPLPKDAPSDVLEPSRNNAPVDASQGPGKTQSIMEEEEKAEHEFRSFDQGPLQDVPAFIPPETPTTSDTPSRKGSVPYQEHDVSPLGETPPPSVVAANTEDENSAAANDRWAQIRKNAAERAGRIVPASPTEDQAKRSDLSKTDEEEGDSEGEESESGFPKNNPSTNNHQPSSLGLPASKLE